MWQRPNPAALLLAAVACVTSSTASADGTIDGYTPLAADGLCMSGGKELPDATTTATIAFETCVDACTEFEKCAAFVFNAQNCRLCSTSLPLDWVLEPGNPVTFLSYNWVLFTPAGETYDGTDVVDSVNANVDTKCYVKNSPHAPAEKLFLL